MRERTLGNRIADAHSRIERRERVLEYHLDSRRGLHGLAGPTHHRTAVDRDGAGGWRQDAGDDAAERGLAATGLADEPQHLASLDLQADTVDGMDRAGLICGAEPCRDALADRQDGREVAGHVVDHDERAHSDTSAASG